MDEQDLQPRPAESSQGPGPGVSGPAFQAAALGLALVSLLTCGFFMLHWFKPQELEPPPGPISSHDHKQPELFKHWPKDRQPDLVLVLSGQQHGYLKPCGCSKPQLGGLPRRYNFLEMLRNKHKWNVVAVDVGDIAQKAGPLGSQGELKYEYSMKMLKELKYAAVGIGPNEIDMPLINALARFALNDTTPRVLCDNLNKQGLPDGVVASFVDTSTSPKVGIIGAVSPVVAQATRSPQDFNQQLVQTLPVSIKNLTGKKSELIVLLYHGTNKEALACADFCRKNTLPMHIILSPTDQAEPPNKPINHEGTLIVNVGHKGRYVGVVGVFRTGNAAKPFEFHYELAAIGEEYETKPEQAANNPALRLLEEYAKEVKRGNYLANYPKGKHQIQLDPKYAAAEYVGSQKCRACHKEAFKVWQGTPHSHAYQTLQKATMPSLANFDAECVECHVVGFKHTTGFSSDTETPHLKDVGCESCHGPGSLHVKNENAGNTDRVLNGMMNPWRWEPNETPAAKAKRELKIDLFCQTCHDIDNDVHWKFEKWQKIIHHEPGLRAPVDPAAPK